MNDLLLIGLACFVTACGASDTLTGPVDASTADQSAHDSSTADSGSKDASIADTSVADASVPYEAGSLDTCNPNDPASCAGGMKCCSEPTHKMPPSAYRCVAPLGSGMCPLLP